MPIPEFYEDLLKFDYWKKGELSFAPYFSRSGKSFLARQAFEAAVTSQQEPKDVAYTGARITVDELYQDDGIGGLANLWSKIKPELVDTALKTLKHDNYPDATVRVELEKLDKRDPLHPNPASGSVKKFYVCHGKERKQYRNKTTAYAAADALHLELIAGFQKAENDARAEAQRIEDERIAHLHAAPHFGDF